MLMHDKRMREQIGNMDSWTVTATTMQMATGEGLAGACDYNYVYLKQDAK